MRGQYEPKYPNGVDRAIAALAARQRGHVSRKQLLDLGLGSEAIKYRVRIGRLIPVYPGVYAVGHPRRAPIDRAAAAVLACGERAVLSHLSAAALWGWVRDWEEPFQVTVTGGDPRPKGICVHRSLTLTRRDTTRHHGIPVTAPARTVIDCAQGLDDRRLTRLVNQAFVSDYLKEAALAEALARRPNRRLAPYADPGRGRTRSELEDKFVAFVERFGLPMPELNYPLGGRVLDAFYPDVGLIIELDSFRFHRTRAVFEGDREKDADATAAGLATIRITDERMDRAGGREAERLAGILRRRRGQR